MILSKILNRALGICFFETSFSKARGTRKSADYIATLVNSVAYRCYAKLNKFKLVDLRFENNYKNEIDSLKKYGFCVFPKMYDLKDWRHEKTFNKGMLTDSDGFSMLDIKAIDLGLKRIIEDDFYMQIIRHASKINWLTKFPHVYMTQHQDEVASSYLYHVDGQCDRFGVMVLLSKCTDSDGPFTIIPARHKLRYSGYERTRFRGMRADNEYRFTCEPGDMIIFNTNFYHKAGNPGPGRERIVLNINIGVKECMPSVEYPWLIV